MPIYEWKCWKPQSQLEIKLILVLIVAIPYLLALIGVVAYYGSTRNSENNYYKMEKEIQRKITTKTTAKIVDKTNLPSVVEEDSADESKNNNLSCDCPVTEICPEYEETAKYPFISAITEIIYKDSPKEYRLKCVATNLHEFYIMTSRECFLNNQRDLEYFQIKAGSDSWATENSSHHTIRTIRYSTVERKESSFIQGLNTAIIHLNERIPLLPTISFAIMSSRYLPHLHNQTVQTYLWKSSFIDPLTERVKDERLTKLNIKMRECKHCKGSNVVCTIIRISTCSNYYFTSGMPLFFKKRLIGMQASSFCDQKNKKKEICFEGFNMNDPKRRMHSDEIAMQHHVDDFLEKLISDHYDIIDTKNISDITLEKIPLLNDTIDEEEEEEEHYTPPEISTSYISNKVTNISNEVKYNIGTNNLTQNKFPLIKDSKKRSEQFLLSTPDPTWPKVYNQKSENQKIEGNSSILYELLPDVEENVDDLPKIENSSNSALSLYELIPDMMSTDYLSQ